MAVNGKSRRAYKGAPVTNALSSSTLAAGATSINLAAAMSGWSTGTEPFFVVIDPGTAKEEKVCVKYNTSTNLIVVDPAVTSGWTASAAGRGADDTTDRQHDAGATIYPVFTAYEANQANELVSKYANSGSVVYQGAGSPGTFTELTLGTANQVLSVNSGATAPAWSKVVDANVSDTAAIALSKLATGALPTAITVASANIVNGTIVDADINSSAAIAYSKLALSNSIVAGDLTTGAVTSAKILDGTIVAGDLASDAVTSAKILDGAVDKAKIGSGPRGVIAVAQNTDTYTLTTSPTKSASNFALAPTLVSGRIYKFSYYEPAAETSTAVTSYTSIFIYGGNTSGALTTQVQRTYLYTPGSQEVQGGMLASYIVVPSSTGTYYYTAAASVTNTTGAPELNRNIFQPAYFIVEDLGTV